MNQDAKPVEAYMAIGRSFTECGQSAPTPRAAAESFFGRFPLRRTCTVVQGVADRGGMCEIYHLRGESFSYLRYQGVTRKTMLTLPIGATGTSKRTADAAS